jgi:FKBP-type peptidyl-prolyl cis-trans isomerase
MSLGTKVRVIVPALLAYGEKGLPPKVPPNCDLVLEIELLSFETSGGDDE